MTPVLMPFMSFQSSFLYFIPYVIYSYVTFQWERFQMLLQRKSNWKCSFSTQWFFCVKLWRPSLMMNKGWRWGEWDVLMKMLSQQVAGPLAADSLDTGSHTRKLRRALLTAETAVKLWLVNTPFPHYNCRSSLIEVQPTPEHSFGSFWKMRFLW